ncbi:bacterial Ig-like domain protein [Clostridium puniceum]|uniref:Bacterial Ig-like domain protein n=1 Tax=Clostridium puniceum TaxID=29367 RepID=A0A1S8TV17_9CLOT|nr:Ig-like domain-containing protein [Clostridium puniceum]OOM81653.1 bacterial Ig-like domain protein [Clostridium puniceum]
MENEKSLTEKSLSITATPIEGKNYVHLEWTNLGAGYKYMVYSKGQDEAIYQSIPSKTNIKVLNIYPSKGNNLKGWMENANSESNNGYGKGLIKVDEVDIDDFNINPPLYLKDDSGIWKYDVIYFGAWDASNEKKFNDVAIQYIESFIKEGRGFLAGHDTIVGYGGNTGLNKLRSYFNIKVGNWNNSNTGIDPGYQYCASFIGSTIRVKKKGLLTNYPWSIGDIGSQLRVPISHSTSNFALGDIWMTYLDDAVWPNYWNAPESFKKISNFYLTTWNNCAMIQTGNLGGTATPDEQKILANTLFYLAQLTSDTSCDDHKGQDLTAPDKVSITSVSNDDKNISVTYSKVNDNGTKYEYYVKASDGNVANDITSNTVATTNTSGIAGYSYVIDNIKNTEPDSNIDTTNLAILAPLSKLDLGKIIYIHIKTIDKVGNSSETTHYEYKYIPGLDLDKTSITLKEAASEQLTAITNPSSVGVTWTSSDTLIATIEVDPTNGKIIKVNAIKEGKATIIATTTDGSNLSASCTVNVTKKDIPTPDNPTDSKTGAILIINLNDGETKVFDVSSSEIDKFKSWYNTKSEYENKLTYEFDKTVNSNISVEEHVVHEKITSFEIRKY